MKRIENNRNVAKVIKRIIKETVQNKSVVFFLRLSFLFESLFWLQVFGKQLKVITHCLLLLPVSDRISLCPTVLIFLFFSF